MNSETPLAQLVACIWGGGGGGGAGGFSSSFGPCMGKSLSALKWLQLLLCMRNHHIMDSLWVGLHGSNLTIASSYPDVPFITY